MYSAVGNTCGRYITRAEVTDTGESAVQQLYKRLADFPLAKESLDNLL